ncbi:MAG: hypothetical protein AB7T06_33185 [Kofleriaceae bacterium]
MDGGGNHPNTFPRGTRTTTLRKDPAVRVIVYAPAEQRASWIDNELARLDAIVQTARSVAQIIDALVEDPPPRPQVLVVDLDAISAGDLLYLHLVRERGWCGRIIGLGTAPPSLRSSLGIERMLNTPFVRDSLADAINEIGFHAMTKKIPLFDDAAVTAASLPLTIQPPRPRITMSRLKGTPAFTARRSARVLPTK